MWSVGFHEKPADLGLHCFLKKIIPIQQGKVSYDKDYHCLYWLNTGFFQIFWENALVSVKETSDKILKIEDLTQCSSFIEFI